MVIGGCLGYSEIMETAWEGDWRIGWADADITPDGRLDLYGQYYPRPSEGIHSRLGATVLVVGAGASRPSLLASLDTTGIPADFMEELRARLRDRIPDLDPSRVLVCATHTHNAGALSEARNTPKPEDWRKQISCVIAIAEYRQFVIERLSDAAVRAWESRQPAGLSPARDFAVLGHCRRALYADGSCEMYGDVSRRDFLGMEGGEDSTVQLLFTCDARKRPTGVVVNVACPSQVMEATRVISSDFMGEARRLLKRQFGPDFGVLCQVAAAGCQSPRHLPLTRDDTFWSDRGVQILGRRLFEAVARAAGGATESWHFSGAHFHGTRKIRLPRRRVSSAECKAAQEALDILESRLPAAPAFEQFCAEVEANEKIPGRPGPYDSKLHHFVLIQNHRATLRRRADQDGEPDLPVETQTLRLGDTVMVSNPFELFLDFGQAIQARSGAAQTMVVQLACGDFGYLPTETAERHGGYGGLVINGQVGATGGRALVDASVEAIEESLRI